MSVNVKSESFTWDSHAQAWRPSSKTPSWALALVLAVWTFGITMALGELSIAQANAEPDTVNLSELRTVDGVDYPVCYVEDCSDQPNQVGLWEDKDTGNWYLSLGEDLSVLVVDDTTTN